MDDVVILMWSEPGDEIQKGSPLAARTPAAARWRSAAPCSATGTHTLMPSRPGTSTPRSASASAMAAVRAAYVACASATNSRDRASVSSSSRIDCTSRLLQPWPR